MSYAPRRTTFATTALTAPLAGSAAQHNSVLANRLAEKKQELESLLQLRDLSASFAKQMEELKEKLATLVDGTEAVALIVANWDNILRVINLASANLAAREDARAKAAGETEETEVDPNSQLPETLVRIRVDNEANPP